MPALTNREGAPRIRGQGPPQRSRGCRASGPPTHSCVSGHKTAPTPIRFIYGALCGGSDGWRRTRKTGAGVDVFVQTWRLRDRITILTSALFRRDRVAHEDVLDEIGGDALIAGAEDERRHGKAGLTFFRGLGGPPELALCIGPRHPFAQQRDVARRGGCDLVSPAVGAGDTEVDVFGQRRHHVLRPDTGRDTVVVAQVES